MSGVAPVPAASDHRVAAPLAAVDDVRLREDGTIQATKRVVATDPYLRGHYPDFTIFPGVFLLEGIIQAFRAAVAPVAEGRLPEMVKLNSARYLSPFVPGDTIVLVLEPHAAEEKDHTRVKARAEKDGAVAARFDLTFRNAV